MNNSVFGKTMENIRKHRDIKLVTTDEKRNKLVLEPNCHTTKRFSENLLIIEMKKTKVKMNKSVYLGSQNEILAKPLCINFGMTTLNQSTRIEQNYVIRILIVLIFILLLKIFLQIFLMIFKDGLIYLIMMKMIKDLFQQVKTKK